MRKAVRNRTAWLATSASPNPMLTLSSIEIAVNVNETRTLFQNFGSASTLGVVRAAPTKFSSWTNSTR